MFEDRTVRQAGIAVLGILALFLLAKTIGEFQSYRFIGSYPSSPSQIVVSGKGEVVKAPDIATFYFSVREESLVVKEAQDEAAKTINAVVDYLKQQGVEEKDIQTSGYNIYPRYEYDTRATSSIYPFPPEGRQRLAAYVVNQSVTVKVRDLGKAGSILSGLGELGVTDISGPNFDFDKRDEMIKEARDNAISEARAEAEKLSKSLGVRLVRIVSYNEGGNYPFYEKVGMAAQAVDGRGGAAPSIPVGEQKIVSNVSITYEVK